MQELSVEDKPLAPETCLGTVILTGIRGRVGETLVYTARDDEGRAVEVQEYWPAGSAQRNNDQTLAAKPEAAPAFESGLAAFVELGEAIRAAAMSQGGTRVEAVLRTYGTAYWICPPAGRTLAEIIEQTGPLPPPLVMAVAGQLAQALEEMHSVGLRHLDVAPSTIVVGDSSLTLAYPTTDQRPFMLPLKRQDGFVRPPYSPLELHDGSQRLPLTAETDVYSASAVVWELAFGSPPGPWWSSGQMEHEAHGYPKDFTSGLRRGLSKQPGERFVSISAWREALALSTVAGGAPWFEVPPADDAAPELVDDVRGVSEVAPIVPDRPPSPPDESGPDVTPRPRRKLGAIIGLILVTLVSLSAAGLAAIPSLVGTLHYAAREVQYRDAASSEGRLLGYGNRGDEIWGKPAGDPRTASWIQVRFGDHKGAYVWLPDLRKERPPTLRPIDVGSAATTADTTAYASPNVGQRLSEIPAGTVLERTGLVADRWTEILWPTGGVAYVISTAFAETPPPEPTSPPAPIAPEPEPPMEEPPAPEPAPEPEPRLRPEMPAPSAGERSVAPKPAPRPRPDPSAPVVSKPALPPRPRPTAPIRPPPEPKDEAPSNHGPAYVSSPQWLERPSGALMVRYTPPRALQEGVSGQVTFDCLVGDDGGFGSCVFKSETPRGYQFAQYSRGLLGYYRLRPYDRDGNPVAGRRYMLTLNFGVRQ